MGVPRYWRKQKNRYRLIGTKCNTCGTHYFPPRELCPKCRRDGEIVEQQFKGTGKIVTFTIIRTASKEYDHLTPYIVAIIELDEGTRITAQVVCDINKPYIGMPVKSVFRKITEEGLSGMLVYGTKFIPA